MNKIKNLAGQTFIYGLSSVISRFLNYLLVPLYTWKFSPESYGTVTEMYAYVSFLLVILTYGMETGFFRFSSQSKNFTEVFGTALTSLLSTSLLFILFIILFNQNIANTIGYKNNVEYITWFGIIVSFDAVSSIIFAKLRYLNKAIRFAIFKTINILINIFFNLFFIVICPKISHLNFIDFIYDPDIGIGYIFISNLIASALTFVLLLKEIDIRSLRFNTRLLKSMIIYSSPLLIAGLAGNVNEMLDRILLKFIVPAEDNPMQQVGIYGANYKLAILMTIFIQTFRYAAEPFFFNQQKEKDSKKLYADVMKYFIIFGLVIFLFVTLYIDIIKFFIGPKYHSRLKIVPVLLLANLFVGIYYNLSIWYKLNNLTKYGAFIALAGAVITVVINFLLIPVFGYIGSAWATFFCYFSMMVISYLLGRKFYKVPYDLKNITIYFIIGLSLFFIFENIPVHGQPVIKYFIATLFFSGFILFAIKKERIMKLILNKK